MTDAIEIELQALICEREAMLALNADRDRRGLAQAYDETAFYTLADAMRKLK
jgi:hypothetical protein